MLLSSLYLSFQHFLAACSEKTSSRRFVYLYDGLGAVFTKHTSNVFREFVSYMSIENYNFTVVALASLF